MCWFVCLCVYVSLTSNDIRVHYFPLLCIIFTHITEIGLGPIPWLIVFILFIIHLYSSLFIYPSSSTCLSVCQSTYLIANDKVFIISLYVSYLPHRDWVGPYPLVDRGGNVRRQVRGHSDEHGVHRKLVREIAQPCV